MYMCGLTYRYIHVSPPVEEAVAPDSATYIEDADPAAYTTDHTPSPIPSLSMSTSYMYVLHTYTQSIHTYLLDPYRRGIIMKAAMCLL